MNGRLQELAEDDTTFVGMWQMLRQVETEAYAHFEEEDVDTFRTAMSSLDQLEKSQTAATDALKSLGKRKARRS